MGRRLILRHILFYEARTPLGSRFPLGGHVSFTDFPHVGVLGPTTVRSSPSSGQDSPWLGSHKERGLLAKLTLHLRNSVSIDELVDAIWGVSPPRSVLVTLQGYIARTRRALEPERAPRAIPRVLRTVGSGYLLDLPDDQADSGVFARQVSTSLARWRSIVRSPWPSLDAGETEEARRTLAVGARARELAWYCVPGLGG